MNKYNNVPGYTNLNGYHCIDFNRFRAHNFVMVMKPNTNEIDHWMLMKECTELASELEERCMSWPINICMSDKKTMLNQINMTLSTLRNTGYELQIQLSVLKGQNRPYDERNDPIRTGANYFFNEVRIMLKAIYYQMIGRIKKQEELIEKNMKQQKELIKIKEIIENDRPAEPLGSEEYRSGMLGSRIR